MKWRTQVTVATVATMVTVVTVAIVAIVVGAVGVGALLAAGCGQDPPPAPPADPVLELTWSEETALTGDFAPALTTFHGSFGLAFDGALETRYDLEAADQSVVRFAGGFTVAVAVRLEARPAVDAAVISRWRLADGGRSYELGVDRMQLPYLVVSHSGAYDDAARRAVSLRQVRLGETYLVSATFVPGARMAVHINGVTTREVTSGVPGGVFDSDTPVVLGNRPGDEDEAGLTGTLGRVLFFDRGLDGAALHYLAVGMALDDPPPGFVPVRTLTSSPGYHWFGYYDKAQIDPTGRYALSMESDFENRSPAPDDVIRLGMVDMGDGDAWIDLGQTRAWNWQQGSMLQWRPGHPTEVLWNDRDGDDADARFVTRVLDVPSGDLRTLPRPVYHVSPDGRWAVGLDFARIQHQRPGYGYAGVPDPDAEVPAPAGSTIYRLDLDTGVSEDLFSLADIASIPHPDGDFSTAMHRFNHLQYSPGGTRFLFYHRWRTEGGTGYTRIFTATADGTDLRLVTDDFGLSHYDWRDDQTVCLWVASHGGFALYADNGDSGGSGSGGDYLETLFRYDDGHQSFLPGGQWLIADTYVDGDGNQNPYLYDLVTDEIIVLGRFQVPGGYGAGEFRVDTHPRLGPQGRTVIIDSPHTGQGRQIHLLDLSDHVAP